MTRSAILPILLASLVGFADETGQFSMTFRDYAEGEELSAKGAVGGAWRMAEALSLTNKTYASRKGVALKNVNMDEVAFAVDAQPTGDVERYDLALCVSDLSCTAGLPDPPGRAAFTIILDNASPAPLCWGDGRWNVMNAPAGVELAVGVWLDLRIEMRQENDRTSVSYLLKSGADYVRLVAKSGRTWFGAVEETGTAREISFCGSGRVSDFSGDEEASGYAPTVYHWIGGASGDWSDTNNWSRTAGGAPAGVVPSQPGDLACVVGPVTLTLAGETANVTNLHVRITEDGKVVTSGTVDPVFDLDVARPRVGKKLVAATGDTFLGLTNTLAYAWQLGDPITKVYDATPRGTSLSFTPKASDYEHWIRFTARDAVGKSVYEKDFYFSSLPVCYLTTDDGTMPTGKKEEHDGALRIQGNDDYKEQYNGKMTVKVRGNSTSRLPKLPYKLKLDSKTKLFGIPKSKHWVLLANYYDPSQMRNKLLYDLANEIGTLGMESTWVEVVFNGKLQGVYQFCEHIRIASDRVPVYDWEDAAETAGEVLAAANALSKQDGKDLGAQMVTDLGWVTSGTVSWKGTPYDVAAAWPDYINDLTGGYLFEFSAEMDAVTQFVMPSGKLKMQTMLISPEYLKTNTEMLNAAKEILQDYWDACTSSTGRNAKGQHYAELCDVESMTAYFLINELFYNFDGRYRSRYAYKAHGEKLVWGPVWDFDWTSKSLPIETRCPVNEWSCYALWKSNPNDTKYYSMFKDWGSDFYFARKCVEKYWAFRARYKGMFEEGGLIDTYTAKLAAACILDDQLWPRSRTAAQDATILKNYLAQRIVWLDAQFASTATFLESMRNAEMQTHVYSYDPAAATTPVTDGKGNAVPAVLHDWLRAAGEGADPSLGYADAARLQTVVTNEPSVWGKATPLWHDYVAGTDPNPASTNATLRFTSFVLGEDGLPVFDFLPNLGATRVYTLQGNEGLDAAGWHEHTSETKNDRFFRLRVDLPGSGISDSAVK